MNVSGVGAVSVSAVCNGMVLGTKFLYYLLPLLPPLAAPPLPPLVLLVPPPLAALLLHPLAAPLNFHVSPQKAAYTLLSV